MSSDPKTPANKPPAPLTVVPDAKQLPLELRQRDQWCCWQPHWDDKAQKWMKPPYSPKSGPNDWQNNLVSFDEVCVTALHKKHGIGYKPKIEDGLVFIDFDDCRRGDEVDPAVVRWIEALPNAYCEGTPSGTGLRAIVKGKCDEVAKAQPVPGSTWKSTVEIYTRKNYVTVTGLHWGKTNLTIGDGQTTLNLLSSKLKLGTPADDQPDDRPRTAIEWRNIYAAMLKTFRGMVREEDSQNDQLAACAWFAARAFLAKALQQTPQQLQDELRTIANSTRYCPGVESTLKGQWGNGIAAGAFQVMTPEQAHESAQRRIFDLLTDKDQTFDAEEVAQHAALLTPAEYERHRKALAKRLGFRASVLDQQVAAKRQSSFMTFDANTDTAEDLKEYVESLLDGDASEADRKQAEIAIWEYIKNRARVFCCGGVGYLLLNDGDGIPIAITKDGQDFNKLLISFGVHPGSPSRERIGRYIGTKCYHEGTKTETRLSFSYNPTTFTAYVARDRGQLVRVTRRGFEDVPNGTDGQLFIFPPEWNPLLSVGLPVPEHHPFKRALFPDGNLVRYIFNNAKFQVRNMTEHQVRTLILANILFLMMPGVVSERAILENLGPTGSGKTLLFECIGTVLCGGKFLAQRLSDDPYEFENQIINKFFIVYDNVSHIPGKVKDILCQLVTGIEVVRRELFTTAQEARYPARATVALSAIKSPLSEMEHSNRKITVHLEGRNEDEGNIDREAFLSRLRHHRNDIVMNLLWRMRLVLEALEEQSHTEKEPPRVKPRLASVGTFIMRIARHEGWEDDAVKLLDAWAQEQTDFAMTEDDASIALTRWIGDLGWELNGAEFSSSQLNDHLCRVMRPGGRGLDSLSWRGNYLKLSHKLVRNAKFYASRFGMTIQESTLRTTRGNNTYRFKPTAEQLQDIRKAAALDRENTPEPVLDFGPPDDSVFTRATHHQDEPDN